MVCVCGGVFWWRADLKHAKFSSFASELFLGSLQRRRPPAAARDDATIPSALSFSRVRIMARMFDHPGRVRGAVTIGGGVQDVEEEFVAEYVDVPERTRPLPPPPAIPRGALVRLEAGLRESIFSRSSSQQNEHSVLRSAFLSIDLNRSGSIDFDEFVAALERFGLHTAGYRKGIGGVDMATAKALCVTGRTEPTRLLRPAVAPSVATSCVLLSKLDRFSRGSFERFDESGDGLIDSQEFISRLLEPPDPNKTAGRRRL